MSIVYVTNVVVGNNPAGLTEPFELEISFECLESLVEDLEWKLVYVGNADDKEQDQELDSVVLGPIQRGALRFVFVADAPDYTKINKDDINGITIILLSGTYRSQEFVRVGWYVHNFFFEPQYIENPPELDEMSLDEMLPKMRRVILADNPRVTRFNIEWDRPNTESSFILGNNFVTAGAGVGAWGGSSEQFQGVPTALDTRMVTGDDPPPETDENVEDGISNSQIMSGYLRMNGQLTVHSDGQPQTSFSVSQNIPNSLGIPNLCSLSPQNYLKQIPIPEDTEMMG